MRKKITTCLLILASFMLVESTFPITEDFLPLFDKEHPEYHTRNMAWYGGRGASKSWQVARGLLVRVADEPCLSLCVREFQSSIADSVLKLLEEQIHIMNMDWFYKVKRNYIEGLNESAFIFKGLKRNIQSIKSTEGIKYCWVEEAQTVSQESWDILVPTIRKDYSQILATFNPHLETDPTYKRYLGDKEKDLPPIDDLYIRKVNYDRNPFFPLVLRKEMEWDRKHDKEKYLHVWEGVPLKKVESLVFKNWRVDGHITPKEDSIIRQGADFGFSEDPSTMLRAWIDDKKREIYIDYEVYGVGIEIDHLPIVFSKVPDAKKWKITADSARPETISYLRRNGFKIEGAKKGAGSVEEGVEFLKSYTIVVHPRCQHLIAELGMYCYKTDPMTGDILPILVDKNNHCIDALRYALEALVFKKGMIHV